MKPTRTLLAVIAAATTAIIAITNAEDPSTKSAAPDALSSTPITPAVVDHQVARSSCTTLRLPRNLCHACPMLPFTGAGKFAKGTKHDMYDIDNPSCRQQIDNYMKLNPCDTVVKNALATGKRFPIVYLIYSLCEQCCDCIPQGAKVGQWEERRKTDTLLTSLRGNCPAHFQLVICSVWPQLESIVGGNGKIVRKAKLCQQLGKWMRTSNAKGWPKNPRVNGLNIHLQKALLGYLGSTRCMNKRVWQDCTRFESAQGRI